MLERIILLPRIKSIYDSGNSILKTLYYTEKIISVLKIQDDITNNSMHILIPRKLNLL